MDSNKNEPKLKERSSSNRFENIQPKTTNSSQAKEQTQSDNKVFLTIFTSLVIDLLAFTVILPLLPSLLEFYGKQEEDVLYNTMMKKVNTFKNLMGMPEVGRFNAVLFGGIIGSLFSLLQFFCCPLIGALSDLYGRKPTLLISMFGVLVSYVIWALSQNFTMFVIARFIGGLSKGNVTICTAAVTDVTSSKTRSKGMALIGIAYSIGFIVGPTIGAVFATQSSLKGGHFYYLPAIFAAVLSFVDILFVLCFFKDTLPQEKRAVSMVAECRKAFHYINPVSLFKFSALERSSSSDLKTVRFLGLVYFLFLFFFSGLEFTLTFLMHKNFQYTSMKQGMMFFFIGVVMATVQGGYVRRLAEGSEKKTAVKGMIAMMPGMALVGVATTPFVLYSGLTLFSFGSATVVPCLTSLISKYGTNDQKGKIMGIFRSLGALARGIGPFMFCSAYWSTGPFWCYLVGSLFFVVPLFLLMKYVPGEEPDKKAQ
ncbi:major facilitator superfamily domain-containing protein 10-like [Actinia tenebrosa]|uniref:Major facilitator superfamily domain-containing protein 10-like n=1 Tax=Actinia tenebrosa TaxID=6105 RepID=A0A6P8H2U6_ACTTE|nr:major facilitator superfamily domain-containing protein 10-like [Actinia tenebrosa]